jgi:hypothetical protein
MFKRNQVVYVEDGGGYYHYGRIMRKLPNNHFMVIDTGKHITAACGDPDAKVKLVDNSQYQGYWDDGYSDLRREFPVYRPMPSLRKLKQHASCYKPRIWKKPKYRDLIPSTIPFELAQGGYWVVRDFGDKVSNSHPMRPRDHNPYSRHLLRDYDIIATRYQAMHKAHNLKSPNWEIKIANDYSETVEIVRGNRDEIMADLVILSLRQ